MTDTPSRLVLWGASTSRTARAWALHELSLDYDLRPILPRSGETKTPEHAAQSAPEDPAAAGRRFHHRRSAAIIALPVRHLRQRRQSPVPLEAEPRAAGGNGAFIAMELDATSLYIMRRHGALEAHIYGGRRRDGRLEHLFQGQMRHVEPHADGRPYLDGRPLHQRRHAAHDLPRLGDRLLRCRWQPACHDYLERIVARPAYQSALRANLLANPSRRPPVTEPARSGTVRTGPTDASSRIVVDNVAKKNAFTPGMMADLSDAFTRFDRDDAYWVAAATFAGSDDCRSRYAEVLRPNRGRATARRATSTPAL